jgi:acetolactate synthase-1/2/3 large subunit
MTKEINASTEQQMIEAEAGDYLCNYLERFGVEYVYGIPGGALEPFFNALARSQLRNGLKLVVPCHESTAAFMADGYWRQSGRLAVCCATTGPGATNLITSVASAYENKIPMLILTAQTSLHNSGHGAFQDSSCTGVNTVEMFRYCTRYSSLVSHVAQLPRKLAIALMTAFGSAKGPVHLSIPVDVMRCKVASEWFRLPVNDAQRSLALVDYAAVTKLLEELAQGGKITLLLGPGSSGAMYELLEFAEIYNTNIVTTPDAKGLINCNHHRYYGVIGFAGHASAKTILSDGSDVVLVVGTNLSEWACTGWDVARFRGRLLHLDICAENFAGTPYAHLHVLGDPAKTIELINANMSGSGSSEAQLGENVIFFRQNSHLVMQDPHKFNAIDAPIKPQRLMRELAQHFPVNTRYFADIGNSMAWAIHYLPVKERRHGNKRSSNSGLLHTVVGFGPMGWAIGAALGAALAYRDAPIICITGDGSMLMLGQEITVAVTEKLSVIFVVLNDGSYGMVKHGQQLNNAESIGHELPIVNFSTWASSLGADVYVIKKPDDFSNLDIEHICKRRLPTLLNVFVDGHEISPISERTKQLI